jgi:formate dehydrogenase major subunit
MKITINGKPYEFAERITVLQACREAGIDIPTLCHDERLNPSGSCRLCVVEIDGWKSLHTSCTTLLREGMKISTHSEPVIRERQQLLDFLISNHPLECLNCQKSGRCKLQDYCYEYGITEGTYRWSSRTPKYDDTNPFYTFDSRKCILCGLCVRVCDELQGTTAIGFEERGFETNVSTPFGDGLINSTCVSCGNCVSVCPVGALEPKSKEKFRYWDTHKVRTTCSYCGVGCQMDLVVKGNKIVGVDPAMDAHNEGLLCVKGKFSYNFLSHPDRLTKPLVKENGRFREASWEEAYSLIAEKMKSVKTNHGSEAFAGLTSARCTNEENYLFQKLFRAVLGTNNVDHCARL